MSRAFTTPVFVDAPCGVVNGPPPGAAPTTVEAFDAALLAEPRFEGPPPPSPVTDRATAGLVEATRRRHAARAQGGDPGRKGVATRKGEVGGPTKDLSTPLTCGYVRPEDRV